MSNEKSFIIKFLIFAVLFFFMSRGSVFGDFLESETDYYMKDSLCGHVHRPHALRHYIWP